LSGLSEQQASVIQLPALPRLTAYYATVTNSKGSYTILSITVAVRDDYVIKPDNNFSSNADGIN
jgi:hypothetical protein